MPYLPEADPYLRRRTLPAGGERIFVPMRDGWPVRLMHWVRRDAGRGNVLMVTGRADFVEKYAETLHDLVDAGWGVSIFDWRGQGLSRRVGKTPMHGASPGFDVWMDDLSVLVDWAVDRAGGPVAAIAHSMGGHLMLRHLALGRGGISRAAVLAPMTGLAAAPLGPAIARFMAARMVKWGRGGDYVLGGGPWEPGQPGSKRQLLLTSDVERYRDESWWIGQYPALALGSVTWGWLADAFASIDALAAAGVPEAIAVPVLALIPAKDGLVDSNATRRLVARIPGGETIEYPGAGHELLREAEPLRGQVLARILSFLG
ncbi:alpha/beta hydrolase [Sandarakinorhabdus oryzae]|uniref:alpha/beta hydrolase n=1 Tax=Sandarakinorhabdus oryzae TaxID=2675220 RepID=UPI0012E0F8BF|nr:alpha/beta hydrolase [Sandarakinorhabdus oryzae]